MMERLALWRDLHLWRDGFLLWRRTLSTKMCVVGFHCKKL